MDAIRRSSSVTVKGPTRYRNAARSSLHAAKQKRISTLRVSARRTTRKALPVLSFALHRSENINRRLGLEDDATYHGNATERKTIVAA